MKLCSFCAEEIQDAAIKCRHCGSVLNTLPAPAAKKKTDWRLIWRGVWQGGLALFVVLPLYDYFGRLTAKNTVPDVPAASMPVAIAPSMPDQELQFISIIQQSQEQSRGDTNDMQRGGTMYERDKKLCALLSSFAVTDWVGTVKTVDSNSDGLGVLAVEIAANVTLTTWNNSLSDLTGHTLIEPGTPLFAAASALKPGQIVRFSGSLFADSDSCIDEQSLRLEGKLMDPEFTFRFSGVTDRS